MKTLYELSGEYLALYSAMSDGEEVTEEQMDALMKLDSEIDDKLEGYGRVINELEADSDRLGKEIKRLQARKIVTDNNLTSIYNRLSNALILHGIDKKKTDTFTFSFRKSSAVEVDDGFIDWCDKYNKPQYLNYGKPVVNKTAVKEALEKGEELPAWIQEKKTLKVK